MNTSCRLTAVMVPFQSPTWRAKFAPPRRSGRLCSRDLTKSCHGYGRVAESATAPCKRAEAIQWVKVCAQSSLRLGLFTVSTPGDAATISASQLRSSTPVPSCHWAYHCPSLYGTWMLTRPARTNCVRPLYMRSSQYMSCAMAWRCSGVAAGESPSKCARLSRKRTASSGANLTTGAFNQTWRPFGVWTPMVWRWRNLWPSISECTIGGNVPGGTSSMVTIRCPCTRSTHTVSPDSASHRPWRRYSGIPTLIPPAPTPPPGRVCACFAQRAGRVGPWIKVCRSEQECEEACPTTSGWCWP